MLWNLTTQVIDSAHNIEAVLDMVRASNSGPELVNVSMDLSSRMFRLRMDGWFWQRPLQMLQLHVASRSAADFAA